MRTVAINLAGAGLLALAACTGSTPAENAGRNLDQAAETVQNTTRNVSAEVANRTAEMGNAIDNAAEAIENRAGRIREAAQNGARDIGNAANGR